MKIKLAMLESDPNYLKRVVPIFNNKYANELEVYSFTDVDAAMGCLAEKNINVFLASSTFKINFGDIPKKCGFAYLVESLDIDRIDNRKAICKYQKAELIYKQVLSIYSEQVPNITGVANVENGSMKTIVFSSPCGGVGTSTVAAACSIFLANAGYRVLFLNAGVFGSADLFFSCDGQFDFSDVIYAVKSNKTNRALKLQSTVKQDTSGVYYYSSVKVPLDMMEMQKDDYITLQNELKLLGSYDYVVLDIDFPKSVDDLKFFEFCNSVVLVSDASETADDKMERMLRGIQILDGDAEIPLQPRMSLILNKAAVNALLQYEIRVLGSIPTYQQVSPAQMAKQLSLSDVFGQLI